MIIPKKPIPSAQNVIDAGMAPSKNDSVLIVPDDPDVIDFWNRRGYEVYEQEDGLAYLKLSGR